MSQDHPEQPPADHDSQDQPSATFGEADAPSSSDGFYSFLVVINHSDPVPNNRIIRCRGDVHATSIEEARDLLYRLYTIRGGLTIEIGLIHSDIPSPEFT